MSLRRIAALGIVFASMIASAGPATETFDVTTFAPPAGFKREVVAGSRITFTRISSGRYCTFSVLQSRPGAADVTSESAAEWKSLVADLYKVNGAPQAETSDPIDGWPGRVMAAPVTTSVGDAGVILVTYAAGARVVSVLLVFNDETCSAGVARALGSLHFAKPTAAPAAAPPPPTDPAPAGAVTSTFDDGWVAARLDDRVAVVKGDVRVSLFYPVTVTDQMRPPVINIKDYFWNAYVRPRFDVVTATNRDAQMGALKVEFVEGQVKEKGSGRPRYAAIYVAFVGPSAQLILVTAPDKATFDAMYREPNDLLKLLNYNKFAVPASELVGTWTNSTTSAAQLYNANTGAYAGMAAVAISASFTFRGDGTYESTHDGASGQVGAMGTFHQAYKGQYTLAPWSLTATKRFNGKTETFDIDRQAVSKSGWILRLSNPSISYTLVKIK